MQKRVYALLLATILMLSQMSGVVLASDSVVSEETSTTHELQVGLWHATKDEASMAGSVLVGTGKLIETNGTKTMVIDTTSMTFMQMTAYLERLDIKQEDGTFKSAEITNQDEEGNAIEFTFEVPKFSEYIDVQVFYMGKQTGTAARIKVLNYAEIPGVELPETEPEEDSSDSSQPGEALSKVENGVFEVTVDLWNASQEQASMASGAVRKTARIQMVNKVPTVYLYTQPMEMAGITASMKELQIGQPDGSYKTAKIAKRDTAGNATVFTFQLPSYGEYIPVKLDAGIEFMGVQSARIKVDYTTLKEISKDTDLSLYPGEVVATPKVNIATVQVSSIASQTYTGSTIKPSFTVKHNNVSLKEGTDYTVAYKNNTAVGTATITLAGKGNYTGTKTITFKIVTRSLANASVAAISTKTYTGKAITPATTVKVGSLALKAGRDYTVSYKNNTKVGTATVTIKGIGNFSSTKSVTFKIKAQAISKATVSTIKNQVYTGKAIKPFFTMKYNGMKLKAGTDYTVTYSNNKKTGKATITIKGKGNFTGSKKVTFVIVPKKVTVSKVVSSKSGTATVSFIPVTGASGYQVSYATSKNGTYKVAGTTKKVSYSINKVAKNKKIYVKVRAYVTVDGKKVYGSYSTVKAVKVK